jgi:hypothetical protein
MFGFLGSFYIVMEKIYLVYNGITVSRNITDQPLFFLCLVSLIVGSQMFLAGFIGEMISRNASERNEYGITKKIGIDA